MSTSGTLDTPFVGGKRADFGGAVVTEEEWLTQHNAYLMLDTLGEMPERKSRLLLCAACRRLWHLLKDNRSRDALLLAERLADGEVPLTACSKTSDAAHEASHAGWDGDDEQHDFAALTACNCLADKTPL